MSSDHHVNRELVKTLKGLLAEVPVEVIGHVESVFACCGNGTVALVKIDKGDPAPENEKPPQSK